ncbi:MAG TPA: ATP-binding protein [Pirellulales bacterium]|nr:ATP-binding protein [Pirellulales bacterium]
MLFDRIDYNHWLRQHQLAAKNRFQPLYEAIENAFNAIEESNTACGRVDILVLRDLKQATLRAESGNPSRIGTPECPTGFVVTDNGVGLDERNWSSFTTAYTPHKKARGGKGVGRLTYLLAFRSVVIDSYFKSAGKTWLRHLEIADDAEGATTAEEPSEVVGRPTGTTVKLGLLRQQLQNQCPKRADAIAGNIVRHFFRRLTQMRDIECVLRDEWDDTFLDLRKLCRQEYVYEQTPETIKVLGKQFHVTHVRCKPSVAGRHEAMLCVGGRVVKEKPIPPAFTVTVKPQGQRILKSVER